MENTMQSMENTMQTTFALVHKLFFSLALPDGQPVLGCARPTCFGWNADGKPFSQNAQFYSVNKVADGFMRKAFDMPRERSDDGARGSFMPQIAECEPTFESDSCPRNHQWVGGIAPTSKDPKASLSLQCCSYNILKYSTDRGVATIHPGEIVVGGEVLKDGRQYAFDYIADIQKAKSDDDSPVYDVTVRRFPCLPMPDEQSISVDNSVIDEMERRFYLPGKISTTKHYKGNAIAFQAPIQTLPAAVPQQIGVQETIEQVVQQPVRPVQSKFQLLVFSRRIVFF
uniref:CN hydrolase domain-containing protein n=1 Tax=Ascaris lumbricoides TaxID=6252 RepID=A0A0M3INZ2_ASCLU